MKRQKNILVLLFAVLFPIAGAVCNPGGSDVSAEVLMTPPKKIEGRMTVEKTTEKFVILLETVTEPSVFKDSVWQISARDRTAGKWLALTRSDASITSSVQGKILRIEVSVPELLKRFGVDASPATKSFFENWEVEEVTSSEYAYLAASGEEKAAGHGRKDIEVGD